jgi:glycerol uptake facilitator-like aquaporin
MTIANIIIVFNASVYFFGKISRAHFNPAVTVGYLIIEHIRRIQLVYYFAEISSGSVGFSTLVHVFHTLYCYLDISIQHDNILLHLHRYE